MIRKFLLCATALVLNLVDAQSEPGRVELTPYGAYSHSGTFSDTESEKSGRLKDSGNFGLLLDIREDSNTQWEIIYSQQSTEVDVTDPSIGNTVLDMNVHYLLGGGTVQGDGDKVRPYLTFTVGAAYYDVKTDGYDSDTFFAMSIGTGLQIRPNDRLGLRLEARLFGTFVSSDSSLFCVSDPGGGSAGCAISVAADVLWQLQTIVGVVFRF